VAAAQSSGATIIYTFFEVPQWAVCFNYGTVGGSGNYYGGPSTAPASRPCTTSVYTQTICNNNANSTGTGWCPGPELDSNFGNINWFAKKLVDQYCNYPNPCSTSGSNTNAINYWEIWNEPDADGHAYWIQDQTTMSKSPDWSSFISQTNALEVAIGNEYTTERDGTPTFIGPAFASRGVVDNSGTYYNDAESSMCGSTCSGDMSWDKYGFLNWNNCSTTCGKNLVTIGTFHMYPNWEWPTTGAGSYDPACSYATPTSSVTPSPLLCTGSNLISNITTRLLAFQTYGSSVTQLFMTEGGWGANCNFYYSTMTGAKCSDYSATTANLQDMRAYVARYYLLSASVIFAPPGGGAPSSLARQYWLSWTGGIKATGSAGGGGFGVLCDDGSTDGTDGTAASIYPCNTMLMGTPNTYYGGYALGQVIDWLSPSSTAGSIASTCTAYTLGSPGVAGCQDMPGSLWVYSVTESDGTNAIAAWVWNNTGSIPCPGTTGCSALTLSIYHDIKTLEGGYISMPTSVTFYEEPLLLEQ